MVKRKASATRYRSTKNLPIDHRLLPDIISFSHVTGIARIFLAIEMIAAVLVVVGTLFLTLIHTLIF